MTPGEMVYLLAAFLLGAVPFGLLIGRLKGLDVRSVGSGNIGATNVGRALGRWWGIAVFGFDFLKGALPVMVVRLGLITGPATGSAGVPVLAGLGLDLSLAAGMAAILGHIYSPFLALRGGKGVATSLGAFAALAPLEALVALLVWALVLWIWSYMALASLAGAWSFPGVLAISRGRAVWQEDRGLLVIALLLALIITWRHRSNITRLMRGEEVRIGRRGNGRSKGCGGRR